MKAELGKENGDPLHDTKENFIAERNIKKWLTEISFSNILRWFDAYETTKVSKKISQQRWSTQTTNRDRLFLKKTGNVISQFFRFTIIRLLGLFFQEYAGDDRGDIPFPLSANVIRSCRSFSERMLISLFNKQTVSHIQNQINRLLRILIPCHPNCTSIPTNGMLTQYSHIVNRLTELVPHRNLRSCCSPTSVYNRIRSTREILFCLLKLKQEINNGIKIIPAAYSKHGIRGNL